MNSAADWKAKILEVLARESTVVPGRAGETPLSKLANEFRAVMVSGSDLASLSKGLSDVIHSIGEADTEQWANLCHLIQLAELRIPAVSGALYEDFTKGIPKTAQSRSLVLVTLAEMGRRWTPSELRREVAIREKCGPEWIDAWVKSGLFDEVKDEIGELLTNHSLKTRDLVLRMPAWYQRLGSKVLEAIPRWLKVIPKTERVSLETWLNNRELQVAHPVQAGTPRGLWTGTTARDRAILEPESVEFVKSAAAQRARRLNGQANP
jgi:hypothetical protein